MRVSCVIATCGRPKYLIDQLKSILRQSRLPDEIIICEDMPSTKNKKFLDTLDFGNIELKYLENSNKLGMVQNFNKALSECNGDLVFLCDDDDIWLENKIEYLSNIMQANEDLIICYHNVEFFNIKDGLLGFSKFENYKSLGVPVSEFVMGSASCFRGDILKSILPIPDFEIGHDDWVAFVAKCYGNFEHFDVILQHYRRHGTNMSISPINRTTKLSFLESLKMYLSFIGPKYRHQMLVRNRLGLKRLACIKRRSPKLKNISKIEKQLLHEETRLQIQNLPHLKRFYIIILKIVAGFYTGKPIRTIFRDFITL